MRNIAEIAHSEDGKSFFGFMKEFVRFPTIDALNDIPYLHWLFMYESFGAGISTNTGDGVSNVNSPLFREAMKQIDSMDNGDYHG